MASAAADRSNHFFRCPVIVAVLWHQRVANQGRGARSTSRAGAVLDRVGSSDLPLEHRKAHNVEVCGAAGAARHEAGRLPPRPAPLPGYVALELIPRDVQRAMENAKDVDIAVILDGVRNSVVPVEKHPDMAR